MKMKCRYLVFVILFMVTGFGFCFIIVGSSLQPLPASLNKMEEDTIFADILDRHGSILAITRKNKLNPQMVPLWKVPQLLQCAFILAEDKRFYKHKGVDWPARVQALIDNLRALKIVRGASTITEQCIRILHPRRRTLFTRFLETIEAYQLEKRVSKDEILEFYLNQVPFSHRCFGVAQAANFYFGRTLDTLNLQEMLALAVIVRAPSFLNPYQEGGSRSQAELFTRIIRLAKRMKQFGYIAEDMFKDIRPFDLNPATSIASPAPHFIRHLKGEYHNLIQSQPRLLTSIDGNLQAGLSFLLQESLKHLKSKNVRHGAIIVLDHQTDEILAWVNGSDFFSQEEGSQIDAVLALRQPGSTLKPFLYALALENGYSPATIISDIPLSHPVGNGLHNFRNYSSHFYGPVRLRCALGNSLNIPAARVVSNLGVSKFFDILQQVGIKSLQKDVSFYGEGLALGNGEISLFELVRAYSVLARGGIYREPKVFLSDYYNIQEKRVFSLEVCSLISNILSDPSARSLEFGESGLLNFPVQTAVKTGTSNDYRDSWAVGYNYKYTVGIWMGNLDYAPMSEITGSRGPALVLRGVFHELNKNRETKPLFFSPSLQPKKICALSGKIASPHCPNTITEWFRKEDTVREVCQWHKKNGAINMAQIPLCYHEWIETKSTYAHFDHFTELDYNWLFSQEKGEDDRPKIHERLRLVQPVFNLHLALDPRIPDDLEKFPFIIETDYPVKRIEWFLNEKLVGVTGPNTYQYLWHPQRGRHTVQAKVTLQNKPQQYKTLKVAFWVK